MTNREQFIQEIEHSLNSDGGLILSTGARQYFEELKNGKASVGGLTEAGEKILIWINENTTKDQVLFSSKAIGEGLFIHSRNVCGAARKLVTDGYLYKEGKNPVCYGITQEGRMVLPESK